MRPLPVFIGFDQKEAVTYHVACQSLIEHATVPIAIIPLALNTLDYTEICTDGSNAFTYSRFLVPYLCGFVGRAVYLDSDVLLRDDIAKLFDAQRLDQGVQVVKHDYKTKFPKKYLGHVNEDYPRKNWSSVILWNCGFYPHRCLTPEFIAKQQGSYLHRFSWLTDAQIGDLAKSWNHLCMEYPKSLNPKLYHFTVASPCFDGYENQEGAQAWRQTLQRVLEPL